MNSPPKKNQHFSISTCLMDPTVHEHPDPKKQIFVYRKWVCNYIIIYIREWFRIIDHLHGWLILNVAKTAVPLANFWAISIDLSTLNAKSWGILWNWQHLSFPHSTCYMSSVLAHPTWGHGHSSPWLYGSPSQADSSTLSLGRQGCRRRLAELLGGTSTTRKKNHFWRLRFQVGVEKIKSVSRLQNQ